MPLRVVSFECLSWTPTDVRSWTAESGRGSPFISDCIGRRAKSELRATRKYPATFSGGFSLHRGSPGTDIKSERTFAYLAMQAWKSSAGSEQRCATGKIQSILFSTSYFSPCPSMTILILPHLTRYVSRENYTKQIVTNCFVCAKRS